MYRIDQILLFSVIQYVCERRTMDFVCSPILEYVFDDGLRITSAYYYISEIIGGI